MVQRSRVLWPEEIMGTRFLSGDLFASGINALAHGCNCAGAMGKGIAVEFRSRFPAMYDAYRNECREGRFVLGEVFVWREGDTTIFNLGTQKTWRSRAELGAIEAALAKMIAEASKLGIERIAMPRIGAGLGGLAWDDVRASIVRIGAASAIELVVIERPDQRVKSA